MAKIIHFEIFADDVDRAMKFYEAVFGWEFNKWGGPMDYWLIKTEEGALGGGLTKRLGLLDRDEPDAIIAYVCTIDVVDVDQACQDIKDAGGEIIRAKTAIPGVGWYAQCKDPEGNIFGIMVPDMEAK